MRYFLDISYVGTQYAGWQIQQNALGIQEVLNKTLSTLLRVPTTCFASGRTDAGVHATQQLVQFDCEQELVAFRFLLQLNALLPQDISANELHKVRPDASARFDAIARTYYYKVATKPNPFLFKRALFVRKVPDMNKMNEASGLFLAHTDFESFSKVHTDVNHFHCTITKASWEQTNEGFLFTITANRFLRGMVRTIVGTLLDIGTDKTSIKQLESILTSRDRTKAGQSVSPDGLYLAKVEYPEDIFLR